MRGLYGISIASLVAASMAQRGGLNDMIDRTARDERLREGRQFARMGNDQVRALIRSNRHRDAALAGGGAREVARRARQLAKIAAKS